MPLTLRRRYLLGTLLGLCGLWLNEATVPLLTQETPQFVFGGAAVLVCFSSLPASLKQYVFNRVVFVVMIPALALAMLFTRTAYQGHILQAQGREQHAAQELRTSLREFLLGRATAIGSLARKLETDGAARGVAAPSRLDHFRQERPEFQSLGFTNAQGVEV